MDRKFILGIAVAVAIVFFAAAFAGHILKNTAPAQDRETLYQVSTIDGLLMGAFEGIEQVGKTRTHGDFGIGTFDGLDGEMIVLNGVVYHARADGTVSTAPDTMTTPFATVTWFDPDFTVTTDRKMNFSELTTVLTGELPSQNMIYAVKFYGTFPTMNVRAIPKQQPPYPTLMEASRSQSVYTYNNTTGTVVGFYTPVLFDGLNVPGFHLHYISDDKKTGGHILDMLVEEKTTVTYDATAGFAMALPTNGTFSDIDLSQDLSADLAKVER